jgi:hypothetical protein
MAARPGSAAPLLVVLSLAGPLLAGAPAAAVDGLLWDQSDVDTSGAVFEQEISDKVSANEFVLGAAARIERIVVWLADAQANDDDVLNTFGGTLSWGIYDDDDGKPGDLEASGQTSAPEIVFTEFQDIILADVARVTIELGSPVSLGPGTYWLALHEGGWGSLFDGTRVWWLGSPLVGAVSRHDDDEEVPSTWATQGIADNAFALLGPLPHLDQGDFDPSAEGQITTILRANDFTVADHAAVSAVDLFLADDTTGDNGALDSFLGTIGWAIYDDTGGNEPANLLFSGSDSTPLLADTGQQDGENADIVRVRVRFGRSIALGPGRYWLGIREGAWASADDVTPVWWLESTGGEGFGVRYSTDVTSPGSWIADTEEYAFVLVDETITGNGFESGTACLLDSSATSLCP